MAAYVGDYGFIELKRDDADAEIQTRLDASDVNVSKARFSVDFSFNSAGGELDGEVPGFGSQVVPVITGDRLEIFTDDKTPLELVRSNINYAGDAGSKVTAANADLGGPGSGTFYYAVQEVDGSGGIVNGYIIDGGYDYTPGDYTDVPLIAYTAGDQASGPGAGATANISVRGDKVTAVEIQSAGSGYEACPYEPDCLFFANVDPMGSIRLFKSFNDSLEGKLDKAEALVEPTTSKHVRIKTRNDFTRCLAQVKNFSFTTSRESIDLTRLGDEFRRQYDGGLITGQGRISAIWDFRYALCDPTFEDAGGAYPEFAQYLAQLCIRIQEGANFAARLFIYYPGADATLVRDESSVWYEVMCQVTNSAMEVATGQIITTDIEFVSTSAFGLFASKPPLFLLMESSGGPFNEFVLDENALPIEIQYPE